MKKIFKDIQNILRNTVLFYIIIFLCSVLTGCSNEIITDEIEETLQTIEKSFEKTEGVDVDIKFIDEHVVINLKLTEEVYIFDNFCSNYNEAKMNEYIENIINNLNKSIVSILRENDFAGEINMNIVSFDDEILFHFDTDSNEIENKINYVELRLANEEEKQQEEIRKQQEEIRKQENAYKYPQEVISWLDEGVARNNGNLNYSLESDYLVLYTDCNYAITSLVKLLVFENNTQYMNSFFTTLVKELENDVLKLRLAGYNYAIKYEFRTIDGIAYQVIIPENSYEATVTIDKLN